MEEDPNPPVNQAPDGGGGSEYETGSESEDSDSRSTVGGHDVLVVDEPEPLVDVVSTSDIDDTDEERPFDITLAASHSYMGPKLVALSGRCVLEAGWTGRVPVAAHHGAVFPGETVPMLLPNPSESQALQAIHRDRIFGLLVPDETGNLISGYGVLCEVYESCTSEPRAGERYEPLTLKARASYRFRLLNMPKGAVPVHAYSKMKFEEVKVLPEIDLGEPLRSARLASLDPHRRGRTHKLDWRLRSLDALSTRWPLFVYDMFDYTRIRQAICDYFATIKLDRLPVDPVPLSFWVASNLALAPRERLALFVVDNALQRLHMELRLIARKGVLCCSSCAEEVARREHIFAMSSEGVHSNYTNLGGYMHDIVTVSKAEHIRLDGVPSSEYSWFPGYTWTIALCANCTHHVGWRFDSKRGRLKPAQFYALCRNSVQPRAADALDPRPAL